MRLGWISSSLTPGRQGRDSDRVVAQADHPIAPHHVGNIIETISSSVYLREFSLVTRDDEIDLLYRRVCDLDIIENRDSAAPM